MAVVTGELEKSARDLMRHMDAREFDEMLRVVTEDAQGIDEVSRRWLRSHAEIAAYIDAVAGTVQNMRSELRDVRERVWGETGLLTCWLEQDYTYEGKAQHISAPTSILFRRENGEWKVALIHSIPLPEASS